MKASKKNKEKQKRRELVKELLKKNLKGWKVGLNGRPLTHSSKQTTES